MSAAEPIDVAIIGGGCAGITAAFELSRPEHGGKYRVTVYQLGFRLGGKGASGRGVADRIEEHGLHLWMGFYENAFRLIRECYEEAARDPKTCPIADWKDAFVPDHFSGVADWSPSGRWLSWRVHLPPFEGLPGDAANELPRWTIADYLARTVTLLRTVLEAVPVRAGERPATRTAAAPGVGSPESYLESMARLLRYGELATLAAIVEALGMMERVIGSPPRDPENQLLAFHDMVASAIRKRFADLLGSDDELRRLWEIVDLVLAVIRGSIRHRLVTEPRGFEAIDDWDCRDWLLANGASRGSVDSAFVRALYDLAFAYEDGDVNRPRIAAGQALRGALRAFFTYRGAFFWKMQAGMGDVVFAPFYEVLSRRGVRFEFFHRLERIVLAKEEILAPDEKPYVEALEFDVQAEVTGGGEYRPLVDVRGLPCWPSEPDYSQLVDGARLAEEDRDFESFWDRRKEKKKTVRVGEGFDLVVLAVGLGAVPHVAKDLVERSSRYRTMVERVKSVPTQAFQIWLGADMRRLGWMEAPINVSGFVEPFDTWADMTHLAPRESWPRTPRAIAYFCSVLPDGSTEEQADPRYPARRSAEVKDDAIAFLQRDVAHLWKNALGPNGEFRFEWLLDPADPEGGELRGRDRFSSQFWTANVNPSDRYSLSLPGTLALRISPLDATFDNFTVAGDWTDTGFNEGCVEAAVMSGRLAAHALSGLPALEAIVGFDHP